MTVKELIEKLKEMPENLPVVVTEHGRGYPEVDSIEILSGPEFNGTSVVFLDWE